MRHLPWHGTAMLASGSNWNSGALVVGAVGRFVAGLVMFAGRKVNTLQA